MKYILLLCLFAAITSRIVMTKDEWVERMIYLANQKTKYDNTYPHNVLYYDGYYWYADCNNLQKSLFNGRDVYNPTKGSYQHDLTNTGDVTCKGLIDKCTSVSTDFSKLKAGEPRVMYMTEGHIGAYLGKEVQTKKGICNSVESTVAFEGGIIFSYVDPDGTRRSYKNGPKSLKWYSHGRADPWVQY